MTTYQESEAEELMRDSEYPRFEHEETFTQSRTKIVSANDLCPTDLNKNFIGTRLPLLGFNRPRPSANGSSARLPSITQIDVEEYPSLGEIESRCVNIVARLFNAPVKSQENALGVSTVGSSEAIILAVLAAKRKWQNARRAAGKSVEKPNLVMNAAVQGMFGSVLPSNRETRG